MFNPFAQGGWPSPGSKPCSQESSANSMPPSIFGALPYPPADAPPISDFNTLYFTSLTPNLLNVTVVGPGCRPHYHIDTDASMPNYTVLKDTAGKKLALVEWRTHPCVEVRGLLPKQNVRDWLRLSEDKRSRSMQIGGARYMWTPRERYLCLYTTDAAPELLARVSKVQRTINLEITSRAIYLGLQESIVVATLLLQSGRPID